MTSYRMNVLTELQTGFLSQWGIENYALLVHSAPFFPPVAFPQASGHEAFAHHGALQHFNFCVRHYTDLRRDSKVESELQTVRPTNYDRRALTCMAPPLRNHESWSDGSTIWVDRILLNFGQYGDDVGTHDIRARTFETVLKDCSGAASSPAKKKRFE